MGKGGLSSGPDKKGQRGLLKPGPEVMLMSQLSNGVLIEHRRDWNLMNMRT